MNPRTQSALVWFYFSVPVIGGYLVMKYSMNYSKRLHSDGMDELVRKAEAEAEAKEALDEFEARRHRTERIAEFRHSIESKAVIPTDSSSQEGVTRQ